MSARTWLEEGGAAFPVNVPDGTDPQEYGQSLRDNFAGKALQGLCANPGGPFQANLSSGWSIVNCTAAQVADQAYELADAMLAARKGGAS